jgi:iron complex transport system substrate-binding protein
MKAKNKVIALLEITVVLCSLFLVAIPAIAAQEQNQEMQKVSANEVTAASEDDFVLGIYGNANEDDTIDMGDVVYTKLAIFGKKPKTTLCDAKYDGRINVLDVIQTKLIILGKEKELTAIDTEDRIVTVKKPIESIVCAISHHVETLRSIKVQKSMIVGLPDHTIEFTSYFPEFGDVPSVGNSFSPDVERILTLRPDVVLIFPSTRGGGSTPIIEKLEAAGMTVLCFQCNIPTTYVEEIRKLGYIFDKEDEANEFIDFYEGFLNPIEEKVERIPEEDKPKVYSEYSPYKIASGDNYPITMAGGKNIFAGMPTGAVDPEAVATNNPDVIVRIVTDEADARAAGDTAKLEEARTEMMGRLILQNVPALKNERVYVITAPFWTYLPYSGCRHFIGVGYLAKWFHPKLFTDMDPKAIHQEYLTRFQGLDYDLDEHGVFVYHPAEHPDGK